jgi:AAA family ATP:ADP antiporter
MKKGKDILRMLNVRKGEEKLVALLILYSFFMGGAIAIFYTVVASSFLVTFQGAALPQVYVAGGIFIYVLGMLVGRLQARWSFDKLAEQMLGFLILSLVLFLGIYHLTGSKWIFFILFIWNRVFVLVNGMTFWAIVAKHFNFQQSKRLSSLINTGDVISSVVTYLAIPLLVKLVSPDSLLLGAVGLLVVCSIVIRKIHRDFTVAEDDPDMAKAKALQSHEELPKGIVDDSYYRYIFLLALIPVFALFYVEYIFFTESRIIFPDKASLASFLGVFFGISAIAEFFVKTFLYNKLITKYGIKAGILILPLSLIFSFGMAAIYGLSYDTAAIFFACIALSRFFLSTIRKAISDPAYQVLYQPIPSQFRLNIQGRIEGRAKSIGGLLAGIVLLFLVDLANLNVLVLSILFLLVTIAWVIVSLLGQNSYKKTVRERVFEIPTDTKIHQVVPMVYQQEDKSYEELIQQTTSTKEAERIQAALGLGYSKRFGSFKHIIPLLQDECPNVRTAAIQAAGELNRKELWPYLLEQLDTDRYSSAASVALQRAGVPILKHIEKSFLSRSDTKFHQIQLLSIVEEIGGNEAIRFLRRTMDNPNRFLKEKAIESLRKLEYTCNSAEKLFLLGELDDHLRTFAWLLAAQYDLSDDYEPETQIMINLEREKQRIIMKACRVLELVYGSKFQVFSLLNYEGSEDVRDYLIEVTDLILPENVKIKILPYLDCDNLPEMYSRYKEIFPQAVLSVEDRLKDIINKDFTRISRWTKAVALKELKLFSPESVTTILVANAVSPSRVISETAFYVLRILNPKRFESLRQLMIKQNDVFHQKIIAPLEWLSTEEDLLICKLRRLRETKSLENLDNGELQRILHNSLYFKEDGDVIKDLRKFTNDSDSSLLVVYGSLNFSKIGTLVSGDIRDIRDMKKAGAVMIPTILEDSEFYIVENYILQDLGLMSEIMETVDI